MKGNLNKGDKNEDKKKVNSMLIVALTIVSCIFLAFLILYFTNESINDNTNKRLSKLPVIGKRFDSIPTREERLEREKMLANYYISLDDDRAVDKLIILKNGDRRLFESIVNQMKKLNFVRTNTILNHLREREARKDLLQTELELMRAEKADISEEISKYYLKLGLIGTINNLEDDILSLKLDFDNAAEIIQHFKQDFAAKVLYYMDENISLSILQSLTSNQRIDIERQIELYQQYVKRNKSLSDVLSNRKIEDSSKELQDKRKYSVTDVAIILTNMDYLSAAKILHEFEDKEYVNEILTELKDIETLRGKKENVYGFTETVDKALKVLDLYKSDLEKLIKSYERLTPREIAILTEKMTKNNPKYKEYRVSQNESFRITEEDMILEVLKRLRPRLLSQVISELGPEKGAEISRKIGLPKVEQ
ncbi:MotE family protein [Alkalithermobacter paradoxus]|uniref:Uncharacterized protein n=1 Tax=Alkalithermobacter paradoxus TaxID=29349 RepID=A0A1V4IAY3_9FIRM|nr:hypothetical protein CLOTH_03720 [[Clostridium] thermoalcaliphilum]